MPTSRTHRKPPLPDRLESLILQLSTNLNSVSEKIEKRIDDLEIHFEKRISLKSVERKSSGG